MDKFNRETRSRIMSSIKSKNTLPEITLRKALWAKNYRYRIHYSSEKIDIAFPTKKIAIFVDGCFWHGCPLHSKPPKSNIEYWHPKLAKNIERDRLQQSRLEAKGWIVLRFWEHEVWQTDLVIDQIIKVYHSLNPQKN